ncbi:bifunctional diaminohydroxyphosphoribosylaminopyrimidine deaminase/5-amino-6-(5-phosphoribosylamino)uracil reductase RibD [Desulfohalovibrio reitneri]|uniref:bifunctional diaminohydroxyphosphoribosylaminopyrimidine deaminase/5-amino-6-(5-phosphoribosylamino)uracil reductase RibD n=1 Tax=Desulfohalovibrio reitneri TaxID=1307759 RepID=UPI0004A71298|nr:bifunctional diaminohydroxyphosphoribosylaminopyrimidine deaminase/5-amino-6-(5-phosphoribosylamino)uracil reductase RibD [Desulfohalovibrio reitneri]
MAESHEPIMRRALELAERARGLTAPNPCVGAVLAREGRILAEGFHARAGEPHAERACLADAAARGVDPTGCDLYVTLEPCNHHGRTTPCTEAILESGVARVIEGCADPNREVEGGGSARLRAAGVEVVEGVLKQRCRDAIDDFVRWQRDKRPHVLVKLAQTIDGRIAARSGVPEKVSGTESHRRVQELRGRADAVLVGGGTLRADDPRLTCRLDPQERGLSPKGQPLAVVATRSLPPPRAQLCLLRQRPAETVFLTSRERAESDEADHLRALGCRVWGLGESGGGLDLGEGLNRLYDEAGVHHVLCEGGGTLAMSLARAGLMDELRLYMAPRVLGDERARASFAGAGDIPMADALSLRLCWTASSGADLELCYRPKREDD